MRPVLNREEYLKLRNGGFQRENVARIRQGDEALKLLDESLERAGLEYFDFYLIHNAGEWRTGYFDRNDLWSWALEQKQASKFKHLGFSAHATAEELEQLLTDHPEMEFVQLQLNFS